MKQISPEILSDIGVEGRFKQCVQHLISLGAEVKFYRQANNSLEAHSLSPAEIKVTLYSSGGILFNLPCLEIGTYEGEYAPNIKEELGISKDYFEGSGEPNSLLSNPEKIAQVFWNAAIILDKDRLEEIRQLETASRKAKELITEATIGRILSAVKGADKS